MGAHIQIHTHSQAQYVTVAHRSIIEFELTLLVSSQKGHRGFFLIYYKISCFTVETSFLKLHIHNGEKVQMVLNMHRTKPYKTIERVSHMETINRVWVCGMQSTYLLQLLIRVVSVCDYITYVFARAVTLKKSIYFNYLNRSPHSPIVTYLVG